LGPEEQMPQRGRLPGFGPMPYLPLPATLFPMPVRYHIYYGEPIALQHQYTPEQADDPDVVSEAALQVKTAVHELLQQGLAARQGVFT